jgi:hypothetical protein
MRHMLCGVLCALSVGAISMHTSAMCYTILDAKGAIVLRSSAPPIDLSKTTSDAMQEKFPGKSLIVTGDSPNCTDIDLLSARLPLQHAKAADVLEVPEFGRSAEQTSNDSASYGVPNGSKRTAGTDVNVRGYYRKDGTYVTSHTRAAPGRGKK